MCNLNKDNELGIKNIAIIRKKTIFAPLNNRGRVPQINQTDYVSKN